MIRLKVSGGVEGSYLDVETCERCGCLYAYPAEHNARCAKSNVGTPSEAAPPPRYVTELYDLMMAIESDFVVALEKNGLDPCPAIKIAQCATRKAWDLWCTFMKERDRLTEENAGLREDVARAERQYEAMVARVRALA